MIRDAGFTRRMLIAALLLAAGGCVTAHRPFVPRTATAETRPAASAPAFIVTRVDLGTSVEGRPITSVSFGQAQGGILIIAAIHGDEPTTAYVAQKLIEVLADTRTPGVAVIPCANPDGLAAQRRTNARGVDLNRNFPAANWRHTHPGLNFGGPSPLSEPESILLHREIDELRPRLIISLHSMHTPCDNYDGPAADVARRMSEANGYPVRASIGYPTPGSLGSWAGVDRQIPVITLELPRAQPCEAAWLANREALLNAIGRDTGP